MIPFACICLSHSVSYRNCALIHLCRTLSFGFAKEGFATDGLLGYDELCVLLLFGFLGSFFPLSIIYFFVRLLKSMERLESSIFL